MSITASELAANNKLAWVPFNKRIHHESDESLYIIPKALLLVDNKVYIKGGKYDGCLIYPVNLDKIVKGREKDCTCVFEDTPTYKTEMGGCIITEEAILIAQQLSKMPNTININNLDRVVDGFATLIYLCMQLK